MRYIYIILSIIFLFIGGLIYIIYRSLTLQMFVWLKHLGIYPSVISLRNEKCLNLPNWVIYCLPDGLWMLSYLLIMLALWHKRPTRKALIYPMILPCFMNCTEILQGFNCFPGTYDTLDLLCYNIPILIYLIIYFYERKNSCNNLCSRNMLLLDNSMGFK